MHCGRYRRCPIQDTELRQKCEYLHSSGLVMAVVHNMDELSVIDPETHGIIIAAGVGEKRSIIIRSRAKKDIRVLNVKDAAKAVESINKCFQERKELRKKKSAEAGKKEEERKIKLKSAPRRKLKIKIKIKSINTITIIRQKIKKKNSKRKWRKKL